MLRIGSLQLSERGCADISKGVTPSRIVCTSRVQVHARNNIGRAFDESNLSGRSC